MSRASGAGAYSHGIAWPSPRPQLLGALGVLGTTRDSVRLAMHGIIPPDPDLPGQGVASAGHDRTSRTCSPAPRSPARGRLRDPEHGTRPDVHAGLERFHGIRSGCVLGPGPGGADRAHRTGDDGPRWPDLDRRWTHGAGAAVDRVAILDPATGVWTDGPALPERMHHAALLSDGTDLWLLGGYVGDSFEQPTDAVWRLPGADPAGTWEPGPPLPERRAAGAAVWDGTRIVYGGGVGPSVVSDVVYASGPGGFTPVARLSRAREHLAAATDGAGRTWFLGGRRNGLAGNLTRVDLVEGDSVTDLGELSRARGGVAAFYWPSLGACLSGGEAPSEAYRDVECMTADGQKVSLPLLAEPRHGHGAAVIDGKAYAVFGGHVPALDVSSTVEVLDLPD